MAFAWDGPNGGNYDLYVKLAGPGEPIRLTDDPGRDISPAWSPDGRWIAFRQVRPAKGPVRLLEPEHAGRVRQASAWWRGAADGMRSGRFSTGQFPRKLLAWTPDGKSLV